MLKIIGVLVGVGALAGGTYYIVQKTELAPPETPPAIVQPQPAASMQAAAPTPEPSPAVTTEKKKPLPTVKTTQTYSIGNTSANFTGQIIANVTGELTWWYDYGKTTSLGNSTPPKTVKISAAAMPFLAPIYVTKLESKTKYYYRLSAKSVNGTANGATLSFTTH